MLNQKLGERRAMKIRIRYENTNSVNWPIVAISTLDDGSVVATVGKTHQSTRDEHIAKLIIVSAQQPVPEPETVEIP